MSARTMIKDYAKKQQSMIQEAKEQADSLFNGLDANDILFNPERFKEFIIEKAFFRFQSNILTPASNLGFKLAQDMRTMKPSIKVKRAEPKRRAK